MTPTVAIRLWIYERLVSAANEYRKAKARYDYMKHELAERKQKIEALKRELYIETVGELP